MIKSGLFVVLMMFGLFSSAYSQMTDRFMVREIASCGKLLGGTALADAQREQPCADPAINEVVVKRFADGAVGVLLKYSDYGRSWAKIIDCSFVGEGRSENGKIRVSQIVDGKNLKSCQIVISGLPAKGQKTASVEFDLSGCNAADVCSHDMQSFGPISGRVELPFGPTFDCRHASNQTEKAICLSWTLSELDFQVATLWGQVLADTGSAEMATQRQWVQRRNSCAADHDCIDAAYKQRVASLCTRIGGKLDKTQQCSK